jgi:hypothetical protein
VSEERPGEAADGRERRRLRFRRREDYAVELFQEAQANLHDPARVDRILLMLGRFYNPYLDAPIVDLATRRRVMESLEHGRVEEARALLEERLTLYSRPPGVEE